MSDENLKLDTYCQNTWCPGCGDFGILKSLKEAINVLVKEGVPKEKFVLTSGIGCHAKIVDYLNVNSFYSLHGRPISTATGIKIANPELRTIAFSGDGDSYNEGISHLIHAAKRNINITAIIHDNRNFALTTGQFTATSPKGFKGRSTPEGSIEEPFNPLELILASGATFIARGYTAKGEHLRNLIVEGIKHEGFSFIEVLQPCVSFFNIYQFYNEKVYELEEHDPNSRDKALNKIKEWDYNSEDPKIPIGLLYKIQKPTYEEELLQGLIPSARKREINLKEISEDLI